jgi:hypothetical protein
VYSKNLCDTSLLQLSLLLSALKSAQLRNRRLAMSLLALLAPFGAVIISLLLAVAVCYAAVYAGLCQFFGSGRRSMAGSEALETVIADVSVLGLHIEGKPPGEAFPTDHH